MLSTGARCPHAAGGDPGKPLPPIPAEADADEFTTETPYRSKSRPISVR
jgi:hypothetical protein